MSLNYRDTEVITGQYGHHNTISQGASLVPCSDLCGTVLASRAPQWTAGQRVMAIFNQTHLTGQVMAADLASGLGQPQPGVLAEFRSFPAAGLVAAPAYLRAAEAACLTIATVTAWMALNGMCAIGQPLDCSDAAVPAAHHRETVLLQGTGGVAVAGLQIACAARLHSPS